MNPVTHRSINVQKDLLGNDTLIIQNPANVYGHFKAVTRTTAGTTIVVSPPSGGAIALTDLIISSDKVANSSVTIRFTDGTNTITIFSASTNDAPVNINIPFAGRWRGWTDARLEVVTVSTVNATVAAGYYKLSSGLSQAYLDWDSGR